MSDTKDEPLNYRDLLRVLLDLVPFWAETGLAERVTIEIEFKAEGRDVRRYVWERGEDER